MKFWELKHPKNNSNKGGHRPYIRHRASVHPRRDAPIVENRHPGRVAVLFLVFGLLYEECPIRAI